MAKDFMNYEGLAQEAMRGVIRSALERVAAQGLPGEHHFYITFESKAPGVVMADWLKERYPDEMRIVLQRQYWGLEVRQDSFDVGLSFHKIPEKLTIPFAAVTAFVDPAVHFALQFKQSANGAVRAVTPPAPVAADTSAPPSPARIESKAEPETKDAEATQEAKPTTGEVVSLDKFRKK